MHHAFSRENDTVGGVSRGNGFVRDQIEHLSSQPGFDAVSGEDDIGVDDLAVGKLDGGRVEVYADDGGVYHHLYVWEGDGPVVEGSVEIGAVDDVLVSESLVYWRDAEEGAVLPASDVDG